MSRPTRKTPPKPKIRKNPIKLQRFIYKHYKTQKEFADKINACPTSVIHWFNGKSLPSAEHMVAIYHLTDKRFAPNYWYLRLPNEIARKKEQHARPEKNTEDPEGTEEVLAEVS